MLASSRLCLYSPASRNFNAIDYQEFLLHGLLTITHKNVSIIPSDILIYNIDPFTPLHLIPSFPYSNRSFAIVCDTHHGNLPLSTIIDFCISRHIFHVNLRFNQRHTIFFTSLGINVYNTIFSPDLSEFISSTDYQINFRSHLQRLPRVLQCGSLSPQHFYRQNCLTSLNNLPFVTYQRFPSVAEMLANFFRFSSVLNISLNLDFNRRIVEAGLCGCNLIADTLEDVQWTYPFSLFKPYITFFSNKNELKDVLSRPSLLSPTSFDFAKVLLRLHNSQYDYSLRFSLLSSVLNSKSPILPSSLSLLMADIKHYDLLQESIRQGDITSHYHHFLSLSKRINYQFSSIFSSLLTQGYTRWQV